MINWHRPSDLLPTMLCGDRIVGIVRERKNRNSPLRLSVILLEAGEYGWISPDDTYAGYSVNDCELWAYESEVAGIADIVAELDAGIAIGTRATVPRTDALPGGDS